MLHAAGELDIAATQQLSSRPDELVAGASAVVLDLRDVTFLDSAGVRLIDLLHRACVRQGAGFRVVAAPGSRCARVLVLVGFGPPLVAEDLDRAVAELRQG